MVHNAKRRNSIAVLFITLVMVMLLLHPAAAQKPDAGTAARDFFAQGMRPQFASDLDRFPDVPQYKYTLTMLPDYQQTVLSGSGSIRYTNTSPDPLGEIVLRIYPNLPSFGGEAFMQNVRVNGTPLEPSLDETRSVVGLPLSQPLLPGEVVTIEFDYQTTVFFGRHGLYDLYSYLETELTMPSSLPMLSVYEPGYGWWRGTIHAQGDAVYSESANWDVTITAPDYLKLITSGTLTDESIDATNGTHTLRYAAPLMRDFSIMASKEYEMLATTYEDIAIHVYYLPDGVVGAQRVREWAQSAVQVYSQTFGDYVYNELDLVQTYTTAGGIEYPGMIVIADTIWGIPSVWFEKVTVHELGHQWWYGMVGNDQTRYPFLDEALTEYSVAIYERAVGGDASFQAILRDYQAEYSAYEDKSGNEVIGEPAAGYSEQAYSAIVYRKGGIFFYVLEQTLGQDVFNAGIRAYLSQYRYQIATPFDLQTTLEEVSGTQLDQLFIDWVGYSN